MRMEWTAGDFIPSVDGPNDTEYLDALIATNFMTHIHHQITITN